MFLLALWTTTNVSAAHIPSLPVVSREDATIKHHFLQVGAACAILACCFMELQLSTSRHSSALSGLVLTCVMAYGAAQTLRVCPLLGPRTNQGV